MGDVHARRALERRTWSSPAVAYSRPVRGSTSKMALSRPEVDCACALRPGMCSRLPWEAGGPRRCDADPHRTHRRMRKNFQGRAPRCEVARRWVATEVYKVDDPDSEPGVIIQIEF